MILGSGSGALGFGPVYSEKGFIGSRFWAPVVDVDGLCSAIVNRHGILHQSVILFELGIHHENSLCLEGGDFLERLPRVSRCGVEELRGHIRGE